jgi:Cu/Ag efflux pump CusA
LITLTAIPLSILVTASLNASLPQGIELKNDLFRQEWFIDAGLRNVLEALRDGTILVVIILILFLMNVRITLITLTAIPLSILVTAVVFRGFGFSVNVMTLGGLAVAVGELVDDAIVDVENVFKRLREWRKNGSKEPIQEIVFQASSEVRNSIVYATALVAVVFLPIFFIPGSHSTTQVRRPPVKLSMRPQGQIIVCLLLPE